MELRLIVSEVDGECGDGAGKESCRGCWMEWRLMVSAGMEQGRSHATVVAVDGECRDGAGKEPCNGCWR